LYAGKIIEQAPVDGLFDHPRHPYTRGLMAALPRLDRLSASGEEGRLNEMPGLVPSIYAMPPGCAFAPRCPLATSQCHAEEPAFEELSPGHYAACWEAGRLP